MSKAKRAAALIGLTAAFVFPAGMAVASTPAPDCTYPATCPPSGTGGEVEAQNQTRTQPTDPVVQASGATLPVTGGDVAGLAVLGGGAFAVGAVLVRRNRRA
jgi:LPXTG-motif cell wall-anchored protein